MKGRALQQRNAGVFGARCCEGCRKRHRPRTAAGHPVRGPGVQDPIDSGLGGPPLLQSMLHPTPTFTAMKRCMNQTRVVATANDKYSRRVDDLVAHLPQRVGHKRAHCPPQRRSFTPPTGRVHPLPVGFLCNRLNTLAALVGSRRRPRLMSEENPQCPRTPRTPVPNDG